MSRRRSGLAVVLILSIHGCTRAPSTNDELTRGARVQVTAAGWPEWTAGIVGTVGECTAIMVPDSWDDANSFRIIRIDSVGEVRVSTRYDGRAGADGLRRTVKLPLDSAGERWTSLEASAIRARYGGCST